MKCRRAALSVFSAEPEFARAEAEWTMCAVITYRFRSESQEVANELEKILKRTLSRGIGHFPARSDVHHTCQGIVWASRNWIAAIAVAWMIFGVCMTAKADPPRNVVLIVGDDMGWTDYGFMGHEVIQTPHLDRLASEGALFPSGYTPTSLCRASLATLLTGLYASQHKICCNDPPQGVDRSEMLPFLRDAPTIPRLLKERGYHSFQSGKFWEGHYSNGGFTHGLTTKGRHGDDGLVIGRKTMQPIYDFISSCGGSPFFVWYAPMMPHEPHDPPERILKKYEVAGREPKVAKYWAMCEWFDETCGELVQWLDTHGLRENTLVVYVVDNGWLQTNGPVRNGEQFLTRSKNTPYEAGVRTPVILRCPGWIAPSRRTELVSTIDLAPTILATCGVTAPQKLPGVNLLPVVREGKPLDRHDVFGEIYFHDCVELGKPRLSVTHRWIRHDNWKLIVPTKSGTSPELYQVQTDPHEKQNLAGTDPAHVSELSRLLDERWNLQSGSAAGKP